VNQITANTTAAVDFSFWFIISISIVLLIGVTGAMVYFAIRYHHKRNPTPTHVPDNHKLEIIWTVIPTLIVLAMFWYGYKGFLEIRRVPADAMKIQVTGQMWKWTYEYENGKKTDTLYVPQGRNVKLLLKSVDVLHSFYIPAFRIKEDAVPGRQQYLWFKPQGIGAADVFCAEFCGVSHAYMISTVQVMTAESFAHWYAATNDVPAPPAVGTVGSEGAKLVQSKGCLACHRLDETRLIGPGLAKIFGRRQIVVADGQEREVTVDEAYLRRALTEPGKEVVKGYSNQMTHTPLAEPELTALIEYLKSLQ
jgi:cytochrome c oxidase subunit 2